MSSGTDEQARPPDDPLVEYSAPHAGAGFDGLRLASRHALSQSPGLHFLGHYTGGVYDFALDVLGGHGRFGSRPASEVRENCRHAGRRVGLAVGDIDATLRPAASGTLIRTVLHTDGGAVCCASIVPGEHLIGVSLTDRRSAPRSVPLSQVEHVRDSDQAVSDLVTELRGELSLGSQNPGGFATTKPRYDQPPPPATPHEPVIDRPTGARGHALSDDAVDSVQRLCVDAVDPADLHYVALCRDRSAVLSVDLLGDRALSRFFTQITVPARRAFYRDFGRELGVLAGRLARVVAPAVGTRLRRLVLDLEQGAVYYYRLSIGDYLVGVTLDQARVAHADDKMADLAMSCEDLLAEPASSATKE